MAVAGGPIPRDATAGRGYYGQPIIKPPVWTWEVGLYLFAGGTAGMSGVLAFAALLAGQPLSFVKIALAIAFAGAIVSPALLIWDLGRPARFLYMMRVFKWRSAMSMGVWTLVSFGMLTGSALLVVEGSDVLARVGVSVVLLQAATSVLVAGTALSGAVLATYTGVLLGATVVPAWSDHHLLLPFHFGVVALGSAASVLELLGYRLAPLNALGLIAAALVTGIGAWIEQTRRGPTARALHEGTAGLLLRTAGVLTGPVSLVLRGAGLVALPAACFVIGAVISRYGWLSAGRFSARDPDQIGSFT
jgi:polysulfide reductase-like protein